MKYSRVNKHFFISNIVCSLNMSSLQFIFESWTEINVILPGAFGADILFCK